MAKCKCSLSISILGDGCSICNPEFYIEIMREQIKELELTIDAITEIVGECTMSTVDESMSAIQDIIEE